ncbi:hypothetical protein SCP_0214990 [Sparassis crispa]|uniref:Uncharacterized protein n=1 Tax=Sparassis crispa TaxID=139825 RepID=A0A401GDN3_9APHY|nr:hypothetical protein SCP_0214990 [Sparassis crispa]GBE80280.1 hypothetical protein SCP_0214990 [Sparassis crispa]
MQPVEPLRAWPSTTATQHVSVEVDEGYDTDAEPEDTDVLPQSVVSDDAEPVHKLAKTCPKPRMSVEHLQNAHGAVDFLPALTSFLQKHLPHNTIKPAAQDRFNVYNQVVVQMPFNPHISDKHSRMRIRAVPSIPPSSTGRKPGSPSHFDMALVCTDPIKKRGFQGLRVGQVRAIFHLPHQFGHYPHPLAYVEWFTEFRPQPDRAVNMYQVSRSTRNRGRNAEIVHVDDLMRPCHLVPKL